MAARSLSKRFSVRGQGWSWQSWRGWVDWPIKSIGLEYEQKAEDDRVSRLTPRSLPFTEMEFWGRGGCEAKPCWSLPQGRNGEVAERGG